MRRTLAIAALSTTLALGAVPGAAAPKQRSSRVERARYNFTDGTVGQEGARGRISLGGASFDVRPGDRSVTLVVTDQTGLPVPGVVLQDVDGDRLPDLEDRFCGETKTPIAIRAKSEIVVDIGAGSCGDRPVSAGTSGTIEATFRATRR